MKDNKLPLKIFLSKGNENIEAYIDDQDIKTVNFQNIMERLLKLLEESYAKI